MDEIVYLSLDEIVILHDELVERTHTVPAPLIHRDKLESALARPCNAAWYEGADLIRQSVLLTLGISQSQAFLDGNKRAAFAAADVFLRVNGLVYSGVPLEFARWLESVAEAATSSARETEVDRFEVWLRTQVVAAPADSS